MRLRLLLAVLVACSSSSSDDDTCAPDDADGIVGVGLTVNLTIGDDAFSPAIVKAQNKSVVTLTLTNLGTRPHGFTIDCLPTPNSRGCATQSCFPSEATVAPALPGQSTTVKFSTPAVEGIYTYRSQADGDAAIATGQFILQ